ncbi:MAG: substrate-binding domain-containing protein [Nocardioides sp.]|uniref:substrate-binding domain-containing protein n=1 Tax=Nocardioides sp. TaxID=35761 RepID=UPI0039E2DEBD
MHWEDPRGFAAASSPFGVTPTRRGLLRLTAGGLVGGAVAWTLAACAKDSGGSGGGSGTTKTVAFLYDDFGNPRYQKGDVPGFTDAAKDLGFETVIQGVSNDESAQASQVTQVLTRGIDCLVLAATNNDTAPRLVKEAQSSNVPVISYNTLILNVPLAAYVARDSTQVGVDLATAAVDAVPEGNYILVLGDPSYDVARSKAAGKMQVLKPLIDSGKITIVSKQWNTGWSPDSAQKQVEQALTKADNDVQAVLASNDGMALGALAALKAQGLEKQVFITGEDAEPSFIDQFEDGIQGVSNWTVYDKMGRSAAEAAAAVISGKTITAEGTVDNGDGEVPWFKAATMNVTPDNVQQFLSDYPWWGK